MVEHRSGRNHRWALAGLSVLALILIAVSGVSVGRRGSGGSGALGVGSPEPTASAGADSAPVAAPTTAVPTTAVEPFTPSRVAVLGRPGPGGFEIVATVPGENPADGIHLADRGQVRGVPLTTRMVRSDEPLGSRIPAMRDGRMAYSIARNGRRDLLALDFATRRVETLVKASDTALFAYDPASDSLLVHESATRGERCTRVRGVTTEVFGAGELCFSEPGGAVTEVVRNPDNSNTIVYHPVDGAAVTYPAGAVQAFEYEPRIVVSTVADGDRERLVVYERATGRERFRSDVADEALLLAAGTSGQLLIGLRSGGDVQVIYVDGDRSQTINTASVSWGAITPAGTVLVLDAEHGHLSRWTAADGIRELAHGADLEARIVGSDDPALFVWDADGVVSSGAADATELHAAGQMTWENIVVYAHPETKSLIFQQVDPQSDDMLLYTVRAGGEVVGVLHANQISLLDVTDDGANAFAMFADNGPAGYSIAVAPTVSGPGVPTPHVLTDVPGTVALSRWDAVTRRFTYTMYAGRASDTSDGRVDPTVFAAALDGSPPQAVWHDWALLDDSAIYRHIAVVSGFEPYAPQSPPG